MRRTRELGKQLFVRAVAVAAAAALVTLPAPLVAQTASSGALTPSVHRAATFEGYVSRVRTADEALAGGPTRLGGFGARILVPLRSGATAVTAAAGDDGSLGGWLAERTAVGGFVTYAPALEHGVTAWHYGVQGDVRLLDRPIGAGLFEPLASLGVGAFRTDRDPMVAAPPPSCMRPSDLQLVAGERATARLACGDGRLATAPRQTRLALSPALAVRAWLLPDVALRADAREVVVYDGVPRRAVEAAVGLSFTR